MLAIRSAFFDDHNSFSMKLRGGNSFSPREKMEGGGIHSCCGSIWVLNFSVWSAFFDFRHK